MALSKRGINRLEKIMLANKKHYDQSTFATAYSCGTEMCAAGFCHLLEVGKDQFEKEAARFTKRSSRAFIQRCLKAGNKLLGVKGKKVCSPIFDYSTNWPSDLWQEFSKAGPTKRVRIYIKMLRTRVNDDGTIREAGK